MTTRDILIEILAIKLYEHEHGEQWAKLLDDVRDEYRAMIENADTAYDIYHREPKP